MSAVRGASIVHAIADGYCTTCGELEEWLAERDAVTQPAAGAR